jgi:hypothetical protein
MKRDDSGLEKLLRWYPRAWRKRYGEEFLAMVEDTLDGGHPTPRLRVEVAWGGIRERARGQARFCGRTAVAVLRVALGPRIDQWWAFLMAGWILASIPAEFGVSLPAATAGRAMAVLDAEAGIAALLVPVVLARGVIALPAFGRFLRAGGWPKIRRRVTWAAGATATAVGALVGLVLVPGPMTFAQWNQSPTYALGVLVTALLVSAAIWLWARALAVMAGQLDLPPRARAGERVLTVAATGTVRLTLSFFILWLAAVQSSALLLGFGLSGIATFSVTQPIQLRRALRSGRRRRPAAGR